MKLSLRNLLIGLGLMVIIFGVFIYFFQPKASADTTELIKITTDHENIWANNQDYATIRVEVPCDMFNSGSKINLTTTLGTLSDTTLKANARCRAYATLKSNEPGLATIIATSGEKAGAVQVNFLSAQ